MKSLLWVYTCKSISRGFCFLLTTPTLCVGQRHTYGYQTVFQARHRGGLLVNVDVSDPESYSPQYKVLGRKKRRPTALATTAPPPTTASPTTASSTTVSPTMTPPTTSPPATAPRTTESPQQCGSISDYTDVSGLYTEVCGRAQVEPSVNSFPENDPLFPLTSASL
jgi:hypothetical protein